MVVTSHQRISFSAIRFVVFFILFYLYVWHRIEPYLIYHGSGMVFFPVFFKGMEFFKGFLDYPGRLIEYVSAFLSQLFYFTHLGSFIITVVAMLLCLLTRKLITAMGGIHVRVISYVPAILLLMAFNQYLNYLTPILGMLISLLFFGFYILTAKSKVIYRIVLFLILISVLFYTASNAYLLFALLCVIFEIFIKRKPFISLLYIFSSALILYIASFYFLNLSIIDSYTRILPFQSKYSSDPTITAWTLYFIFPIIALCLPLWEMLKAKLNKQKVSKSVKGSKLYKTQPDIVISGDYRINKLNSLFKTLILLLVAGFVALFTFNERTNIMLRVNYFSSMEKWYKVLEETKRIPFGYYDPLITHEINKALYYTGRLPYDMFSYPQDVNALLTLSPFNPNQLYLPELPRISDTCFRIGLLNYAELSAHEALEIIGERPAILKQLFLINVVKGNIKVAKVFLNLLSKDLIYGKEAERYKQHLIEDTLMTSNDLVRNTRSMILDTDFDTGLDVEIILKALLHNKQNRMAFEYLMAYYLLSFQLDKLTQNIYRLNDYNYTGIPRHYEEAIIVYTNMTGKEVDLNGRMLSGESVKRFQKFDSLAYYYINNREEGLRILLKNFGNSYYYYLFSF